MHNKTLGCLLAFILAIYVFLCCKALLNNQQHSWIKMFKEFEVQKGYLHWSKSFVLAVQISSHITFVTKTSPDTHIPVWSSSLKYLHSSSYGIRCNTMLFWWCLKPPWHILCLLPYLLWLFFRTTEVSFFIEVGFFFCFVLLCLVSVQFFVLQLMVLINNHQISSWL